MEKLNFSTINKNKEARQGSYQQCANAEDAQTLLEASPDLIVNLINRAAKIHFQATIRDGIGFVNGTSLSFSELTVGGKRGARSPFSAEETNALLALKATGLSQAEIVAKLNALR